MILRTCHQIMQEEDEDTLQIEIENSQALRLREEVVLQFN